MTTADYYQRFDAVLDKADFGPPVDVDSDTWSTPFGPICRTFVDGQKLMGVGPVIMVRRSRTLDILGGVPQPLATKLRFDDRNRLYLTVDAENGSWTWRLQESTYVTPSGYQTFIGRWPD